MFLHYTIGIDKSLGVKATSPFQAIDGRDPTSHSKCIWPYRSTPRQVV